MPQRSSLAAQKPGFILRGKAEADLEEIGDYTLKHWGDAKLVEYVTMLNDAFRALAADPNLGRSADDVRKGYFRHHVGSHMAYFRREKAGVEIVRILHEKMSRGGTCSRLDRAGHSSSPTTLVPPPGVTDGPKKVGLGRAGCFTDPRETRGLGLSHAALR